MSFIRTAIAALVGAADLSVLSRLQEAPSEHVFTATLDEDDLLARPSHSRARLAPPVGSVSEVGAYRLALADAKRQRKNLKRVRDWARSDAGYYFVQA
jgi:hypothetical protein